MKTMLSLRLAVLGAVALFTQTNYAQTWQTVADFRYFGHYTVLDAMTKDPFGNLYAAGYGSDTDDRALITKSSDGGATWSVADAFAITPNPVVSEYTAMTSDGAGNLYALGNGFDANSLLPTHWFVRRSQDSGATWSTVLDLTTVLRGVATDAAGNVYVLGPAWSVLKSADGGNSWTALDIFNPGRTPNAYGILCHPTLGIFVAGNADLAIITKKGKTTTTTYQRYGYVRRSLDGGATWTTVDAYLIDANAQRSGAEGPIAADPLGNLYVIGYIGATLGSPYSYNYHWIVRKSANGGASWSTVDDYFPNIVGTNYSAIPHALAADTSGNLFVAGSIYPAAQIYPYQGLTQHRWIVRKLAAGTSTWQTVDNFQYAPGRNASPGAVVADDFGSVFVGGYGNDTSSVNGSAHGLVRKLAP